MHSEPTDPVVDNIRALLARQRRAQGTLAGPLGISPQQVSARLAGRVSLRLDELRIIAQELGVSVESLIAVPA